MNELRRNVELQQNNFLNTLGAVNTSTDNYSANPADQEITVISPDGVEGTIPASQLDEALKSGYKKQ